MYKMSTLSRCLLTIALIQNATSTRETIPLESADFIEVSILDAIC